MLGFDFDLDFHHREIQDSECLESGFLNQICPGYLLMSFSKSIV